MRAEPQATEVADLPTAAPSPVPAPPPTSGAIPGFEMLPDEPPQGLVRRFITTQRECLEILGCVGKGKVKKLAEIIAGVVLAGELSLASAISSLDWVSSHEQYGRNR